MDWRERITADERVCHGKPCFKGTRILVSAVLANLAERVPNERILAAYPPLTDDDLQAALAYAAELSHGYWVDLPPATA